MNIAQLKSGEHKESSQTHPIMKIWSLMLKLQAGWSVTTTFNNPLDVPHFAQSRLN